MWEEEKLTELLKYDIRTMPPKFTVNERGEVILDVRVPVKEINCKKITIHVPVGLTENAVFKQANAVKTELIQEEEYWKTLVSKEPEEQSFKTIIIQNEMYEEYPEGEEPTTMGVTIKLTGDVSSMRGTFMIEIEEESGMWSDAKLSKRKTSVSGNKEMDVFYCENFFAAKSKQNYITCIETDTDLILRWEGNGKKYTIYYDDKVRAVEKATTLTISGGIREDTGFMLVAEWGSQQICRFLEVKVKKPEIFGRAVEIYNGSLAVYNKIFVPDTDGLLLGTADCENQGNEVIMVVMADERKWINKSSGSAALTVPVYAGQTLTLLHEYKNKKDDTKSVWNFMPIGRESKL